MITKESVVTAVPDQVSTDLGGEVAILHLTSGIYFSLNEIGARIWQMLQEPRPVNDILQTLLDEYDITAEECDRHLLTFLAELEAEKLVQVGNGSHS